MLKNLPEINFVTADPQELLNAAIKVVEKELGITLARASPVRLLLNSVVNIIMQQRLLIDTIAKNNLLAYATGDYLAHLGALVGVERLSASKATATCQVKLSAARETTTTIKKNTRVTADDEVFFSLDNELIFLAGVNEQDLRGDMHDGGACGQRLRSRRTQQDSRPATVSEIDSEYDALGGRGRR